MARGGIEREQAEGRHVVVRQHRHDIAALQRGRGDKIRQPGDAQPGERRLQAGFGIGEAQTAAHRHGHRLARLADERPVPGIAEVGVGNALMLADGAPVLRRAVLLQIARRSGEPHRNSPQTARNQAAVAQVADAYGDIEAFVHDTDRAIGKADVQFDQRIASGEGGQHAGEHRAAEGHGRADIQPAARGAGAFAYADVERVKGVKQRFNLFVVSATDVGGRQRARAALNQLHAELPLQLRHQL